MKTFIVTKVVVYQYHVLAKNKTNAIEEVQKGYDPYNTYVKSEKVVICNP